MPDSVPSPEHLEGLAALLQSVDTSLVPGADAARVAAARLAGEYLAPRARHPDHPLVVAVVGLSGSGKSTLFNSVAGRRLSATGSRRPTTLEPVAWRKDELPATLAGIRRRVPGRIVETLRTPPGGVVIVDAPPPDVLDGSGRPVVDQMLELAEACVVVTSATRYADAGGFRLAELAQRRKLATFFVLNRVPPDPEAASAIIGDYEAKLAERGFLGAEGEGGILAVGDERALESEFLSHEAVAALTEWIASLGDEQVGQSVVEDVVASSSAHVQASLAELRRGLLEVAVHWVELSAVVERAYARALDDLVDSIASGRFRRSSPDEVGGAIAAAATRHAGRAARNAADRWAEILPDVVAAHPDLYTHAPSTAREALRLVESWAAAEEAAPIVSPRRRRIRRRARQAWVASVIDPDGAGGWRSRRLLRRHSTLAGVSRRSLEHALYTALEGDAARFYELLGSEPQRGVLGSLQLEGSP